jgi:hypothetical protein
MGKRKSLGISMINGFSKTPTKPGTNPKKPRSGEQNCGKRTL